MKTDWIPSATRWRQFRLTACLLSIASCLPGWGYGQSLPTGTEGRANPKRDTLYTVTLAEYRAYTEGLLELEALRADRPALIVAASYGMAYRQQVLDCVRHLPGRSYFLGIGRRRAERRAIDCLKKLPPTTP